MRVILASNSPRRRELLARQGVDFEVVVSGTDEQLDDALRAQPQRAAQEIAQRKAWAVAGALVAEGVAEPTCVVGADTMVVLDGVIFGKPSDSADATRMIEALSGRAHQVITGVAVVMLHPAHPAHSAYSALPAQDADALPQLAFRTRPACVRSSGAALAVSHRFATSSTVVFKQLSADDITAYVATGECLDKAGAYAIQGQGSALVERYEGDFDNIVGLPVGPLLAAFPELA